MTLFEILLLDTLAVALFVVGLRGLSSPRTAVRGNRTAAAGMILAIAIALMSPLIVHWSWIIVAGIIGSAIGLFAAQLVPMTSMPQMVALFNGFGGGASMLVSAAELVKILHNPGVPTETAGLVTLMLGTIVGGVTFTGSIIAYAKLEGLVTSRPVVFPLQRTVNFSLLGACAAATAWFATIAPGIPAGGMIALYWAFFVLALVLGVLLVIPIGGGDMPVVIALLNSYSGIAGSMAGFVLNDVVLITAGALVGASGIILTRLMCKAMNRSLANVLFGGFGQVQAGAGGADFENRPIRQGSPQDAVILMSNARLVIIVPGYGLAVARAQRSLREVADLLQEGGTQVKYAIHPVAGRMPGHMNVLLAEADVPYDQLYELDRINPEFENADVVLVVGANDVVNPAARHDKASPIYGMPILDADKARNILVLKRSMSPGFAGIQNELFFNEKTMMIFGDAQDTLSKMVADLKQQ